MRALLLLSAAVSATLTLIMVLFLRIHRRYPGFAHWTVGTALISANFLLSALRGMVPPTTSIVLINIMILLAPPVFLDGIRRFLNLAALRRTWYLPTGGALVACMHFLFVTDEITTRTAILMLSGSLYFAAAVVLLARHASPTASPLFFALAAQLALISAAMLGRAFWVLDQSGFSLLSESAAQYAFFGSTTVLHLGITVTFILMTTARAASDLSGAQAELAARVEQLRHALTEVKTLRGLLPICAGCKRIRDDSGAWIQVEVYVRERSDAEFTHGFCPECLPKFFPTARQRPETPQS